MKKFEIIVSGLIIFTLILRLLDFPISFIFVIASLVLSFFYFIFTFALLNNLTFKEIFVKSSYNNIGALRTIGLISLGIGLSLTIIGTVFIVQHWMGALSNLVPGIIILFIIGIISLIKRNNSFDKKFYDQVLLRIGVWFLLSFIVLVITDIKYW